jgi:hypothetical protein
MNKKLLLCTLGCMALAFTSSAFAQFTPPNCSNGATLQVAIVGSSAQFNTFAYAAEDLINNGLATGPANLFSVKGTATVNGNKYYSAAIEDVRPGDDDALDSATLEVIYDNPSSGPCNVFAYYSVDSTVGNRAYFAATHVAVGTKNYAIAGVQPCLAGQTTSGQNCTLNGANVDALDLVGGPCNGTGCSQNQVGGQCDGEPTASSCATAATDYLPTTVFTALSTVVQPTGTNSPPAYCGQLYAAGSTSAFYCYFNAAATDIRPEDAYYASTRALAVPGTGLTGLNYKNTNCTPVAGGGGGTGLAARTCQIFDSFGQKGTFNVLSFNLTGKDPYDTVAAVPPYVTLSVGASPVLVEVSEHGAGTTSAFNSTYTDLNNKTVYLFSDILRKKLAFIFEGTTYCTGDILPGAALPCEGKDANGNSIPYGCGYGSGPALQAVHREPLSGTYNTFEFTGVRTLTGSSNAATSKLSTTAWVSDDEGGQEMFPQAAAADETNAAVWPWIVDPGAVAMGWNAGALAAACGGPLTDNGGINIAGIPTGTQNCSDPLFISGSNFAKAPSCASGNYLSLRAIGTGQEVPDVLGLNNSGAATVDNGIGYAFWSYGNFAKACSGGSASSACSPIGHYLTVDSVDPLFATEGGYYDRTDGANPNTFPVCDVGESSAFNSLPCTNTIPFTHMYDGKYPLWSLLRWVTFPNTAKDTEIPPYVADLLAYNEKEVADTTDFNTADFVPFLTNLKNGGTLQAPTWTGDLNLGVFRVHTKGTGATAVNNGHTGCIVAGVANFAGVAISGGKAGTTNCLIDFGNDVGGTVMTVQDDVDFILDFQNETIMSVATGKVYEEYDLHQ